MKNKRKVLAVFLMLALLIVPARVRGASPEIDIDGIQIFRFPHPETEEPVSAVSIPFGDTQTLYSLLLKSTDTPPASSAELKDNTEGHHRESAPSLYLEWPSLELNTEYTLYLAAENDDGFSDLYAYRFMHLTPPPDVEITSPVELQSATSARVSYTVYGDAQAVYWLLVSEADAHNPTEAEMRRANRANASPGAHTLELSGFGQNADYTLYIMAENATGCSARYPTPFSTVLPPPDINNVSVFGVSARAATVEMMVGFRSLPDGMVYMLVLEAADPSWPNDSTELKPWAIESGVSFPMHSGVETQQLSGLTPGTEYYVYITAESEAGLAEYEFVLFTTLEDNAESAPVITASPVHQTVDGRGDVHFTVEASGDGLHYQWQSTDPTYGGGDWVGGSGLAWENLSDDETIGGTATNQLVISASAFENDTYSYNIAFRCVVTNGAGSVVSDLAVLAVEGFYPILKSISGVSVDEHHPIGPGLNMDNRFEANVTVPYTTTELYAFDLIVDNIDGHPSLELYSGDDYAEEIPSQTLNDGPNDVYFTIGDVETRIYYHVIVIRETGNPGDGSDPGDSDPGDGSDPGDSDPGDSDPGGSDPGGGSSSGPTKTDNANSNPNTGAEDYPDVPQTGDNGDAGLWTILLIASVLGIAGIVAWCKKQAGKGTW